jgi:tetratricopeptide (TPR) repeat protein
VNDRPPRDGRPDSLSQALDDARTALARGQLLAAEQGLSRGLAEGSHATDTGAAEASHAEAHALRGAVRQLRGHPAAAVGDYDLALAAFPDDIELACNRAHALLEAGRGDDALRSLAASAAHPRSQATTGALLLALGRMAEARETLRAVTASGRTDETAWINLALAERALGAPAAALAALREACDIDPRNARAVAERVEVLIDLDRAAEACTLAERHLDRHPEDRQVLAAWALALGSAGRPAEAQAIADPARMVTVHDLGDTVLTAALCAELAALLRDEASARDDPPGKATYGGRQTGELDPASHPALLALGSLLVDLALATRGEDPRGEVALRMWGTLLPPGGAQRPHHHPLGHLSGVVYLALPEAMQAEDPLAGALEFGRPQAVHAVAPLPGRVVLFPSHLWHGTRPFSAPGLRISVAFDVVFLEP